MNRLELVNRLISEAGVTDRPLSTTLNQSGDAARYVNWIDDAWLEVQGMRNWPALWEQATVTVPAGESSASGTLGHERYVKDSATINGGELFYLPWDEFRLEYRSVTEGNPSAWTIRPDRSFAVNAIVTADTPIQVERFKLPGRFSANDNAPALFTEHHMMIVWRALMLYGGFDEAGVAYKRGKAEYESMKQLAGTSLPNLRLSEPLL